MNWEKIKSFIIRFNLSWILFYVVLTGAMVTYAKTSIIKYEEQKLPSGHIELKLDKVEYQLGENINFQVVNHFPVGIYVINQCPSEPLYVFRWENDEWIQIHDKVEDADSECYLEPRNILINSEGGREYDFHEWPNLFKDPGVYRIALAIEGYDDIPFQDFKILEPVETIEIEQNTQALPVVAPVLVPEPIPVEPIIETVIEEEYYYEYEYDDDDYEYEYDDDDEYDDD